MNTGHNIPQMILTYNCICELFLFRLRKLIFPHIFAVLNSHFKEALIKPNWPTSQRTNREMFVQRPPFLTVCQVDKIGNLRPIDYS